VIFNIDLEDRLPPVSFTLKPADAQRFQEFMSECQRLKAENAELRKCLAFFSAVIKSQDAWSEDCQFHYDSAMAAGVFNSYLAEGGDPW